MVTKHKNVNQTLLDLVNIIHNNIYIVNTNVNLNLKDRLTFALYYSFFNALIDHDFFIGYNGYIYLHLRRIGIIV